MKSARNQLILLGFICQGLTWEGYALVGANALIWGLCLAAPRKPVHLPSWAECGLMGIGAGLGYLGAVGSGQSTHFFIGHGVTLLQAGRLMRPLNQREKIFSFLLAMLQIGVGCTVLLDVRFIVVLMGALLLVPRTLKELTAEEFTSRSVTVGRARALGRSFVIGAVMLLFFLLFPRGFLETPFPHHGAGPGREGTLADMVLDPSRSGLAQSGRILLQIEGPRLDYLRTFTLVNFDGRRWHGDGRSALRRIDPVPRAEMKEALHRRVKVRHVGFLGGRLPVDGEVMRLEGDFFRRPLVNAHGIIECEAMWSQGENEYEYWIHPGPNRESLSEQHKLRLTQHPPVSERLRGWLQARLAGVEEPVQQARHLERYFRDRFSYELGAPELNRINALEDFLFSQRRGHCERFASALALLLRMQNIPTRVVVGYAPSRQNWFSGWYNIRFKDAHAWTEAWFEDIGWVTLDATPRASMTGSGWGWTSLWEGVEFAWYSHIINFDWPTQKALLEVSYRSLADMGDWIQPDTIAYIAAAGGLMFLVMWRRYHGDKRPHRKSRGRNRFSAGMAAAHYYGRMLRQLERRGRIKSRQQTPYEFLKALELEEEPELDEIRFITEMFCATRYGHHPVSAKQEETLRRASERVARGRFRNGNLTPEVKENDF